MKDINNFKIYGLSICAIIKNELTHLQEWLEFHKLIGVQKFYLYDHQKNENTTKIIQPYVMSKEVTYTYFNDIPEKLFAYNHCLENYGQASEWIAFIDLDEFLFSPLVDDIKTILKEFEEYPAIGVNRLTFGSFRDKNKPLGLKIEDFTRRAKRSFGPNRHVKSIVRPDKIIQVTAGNKFIYNSGWAVDENKQILQGNISHQHSIKKLQLNYYVNSHQEKYIKKSRSKIIVSTSENKKLDDFYQKDQLLNQIEDLSIQRFLVRLKNALVETKNNLKEVFYIENMVKDNNKLEATLDTKTIIMSQTFDKDMDRVEIVSVHIPKTAGTVFKKVLLDVYGTNQVFLDYPKGNFWEQGQITDIPADTRVIHGHFPVSKYQDYFPNAKRIVWLRDPIKRIISNYVFSTTHLAKRKIQNWQKERELFLQSIQHSRNCNLMSYCLKGMNLDDFFLVGIQNFFASDLQEIELELGWPNIDFGYENESPYSAYNDFKQNVLSDQDLMVKLQKLNAEDIDLYNNALVLREKRRKNKQLSTFVSFLSNLAPIGKINNSNLEISGWLLPLSMDTELTGFKLDIANQEITEIEYQYKLPSPGVQKTYPKYPDSHQSRFNLLAKLNQQTKEDSLIKLTPLFNQEIGYSLFGVIQPSLTPPSQKYLKTIGNNFSIEFKNNSFKWLGYLIERVNLKPTDQILEIYCGLNSISYGLAYYLHRDGVYHGLEVGCHLTEWGKNEVNPIKPNFNFQSIDIYHPLYNLKGNQEITKISLPYTSNSFDVVCVPNLFTHLQSLDLKHYLDEIHRVLKPGGKLIFSCFLLNSSAHQLIATEKSSQKFIYEILGGFTTNPNLPEKSIGFNENLILEWTKSQGFHIKAKYYGSWCGRKSSLNQDMIIVEKKFDYANTKYNLQNIDTTTYKILSVKQEKNIPSLRGFEIEEPKFDDHSNVYNIQISGWVLPRKYQSLHIEIVYDNTVLRKIPVNEHRPDIARRYPKAQKSHISGFTTAIGIIGLPLQSTSQLIVNVVLANNTRILIGVIEVERVNKIQTNYSPKLQPIILTCIGRSGTTWMMRLLSEHPGILVAGDYPYEVLASQYWLHCLKILSEPANIIDSTPSLHSFQQNLNWIGHHPSYRSRIGETYHWFGQEYQRQLLTFCQKIIDDFYQEVAITKAQKFLSNNTDHTSNTPSYFVEKYRANYSLNILDELYPESPEIILIRDFRDVLCSRNAFFGKHNQDKLLQTDDHPDQETLTKQRQYINDFAENLVLPVLQRWRKYKHKVYLLHYENLILFPEETLSNIYNYLDLDNSLEIVSTIIKNATSDTKMLNKHKTTSDPKSSIGRWQSDLSQSFQCLCDEILGEFLEEFGYAKSHEYSKTQPVSKDIQSLNKNVKRKLNTKNAIKNNLFNETLDKYEKLLTQYENQLKNFEITI